MSNSKMQIKRRAWPEKRRKKQAETCRKTKPWKRATGPKTESGKEAAKYNALRHGMCSNEGIQLRKLLTAQRLLVHSILKQKE